jgi:predicted O-methyltransferase YrrM
MDLVDRILQKFTFVRRLQRRIARLEAENSRLKADLVEWGKFSPPGHFYSPLPSAAEVEVAFARGSFGPPFAGMDLNEQSQFALLEQFAQYYPDQPFPEEPVAGKRFYLRNPSYGHFDAIMLYCMLRHLNPARIIEVGSGYSSAAMLDLNDQVMGGRMALTFIDPDMSRLRPLLYPGDETRVTLIESCVQDVPLEAFTKLQAGDVLFIDSSHVSKIGSDVNRLFFDILPVLQEGVLVHIHDIAGNLEYPRDWLLEGRAWNEQYLLRAFLMYNCTFEVALFPSWLADQRHDFLRSRMPLCAQGGGGQMWLRRKRAE